MRYRIVHGWFAVLIGVGACTEPITPPTHGSSARQVDEEGDHRKARADERDAGSEGDGEQAKTADSSSSKQDGQGGTSDPKGSGGSVAPESAGAGGVAGGMDAGPGATSADEPDAGDGTPADEPLPSVVGTWFGQVLDSTGVRFNLCLSVEQDSTPGPAGRVQYAGIGFSCRGTIQYIGPMDDVHEFMERVTGTNCIPTGTIHASLSDDGTLRFEWFQAGVEIPAELGMFDKVDACP